MSAAQQDQPLPFIIVVIDACDPLVAHRCASAQLLVGDSTGPSRPSVQPPVRDLTMWTLHSHALPERFWDSPHDVKTTVVEGDRSRVNSAAGAPPLGERWGVARSGSRNPES